MARDSATRTLISDAQIARGRGKVLYWIVLVAVIFHQMGMVSVRTATRLVYLR